MNAVISLTVVVFVGLFFLMLVAGVMSDELVAIIRAFKEKK